MWRAVIDTNVLVSALLKPDSVPRLVIDYMFAGHIIPLYNNEIIAEYAEVLHRRKFGFQPADVDFVLNKIAAIGKNIEAMTIDENIPDEKDIVFYAITLSDRRLYDTYLVTGNLKHFPKKNFIVTPRQMLEMMGVIK